MKASVKIFNSYVSKAGMYYVYYNYHVRLDIFYLYLLKFFACRTSYLLLPDSFY